MPDCKICGSPELATFAHTATCGSCGVLLCYPYPPASASQTWPDAAAARNWYRQSSERNHRNFTNMLGFARSFIERSPVILDFGGGGGQFALVCKSLMPECTVHIVDIDDSALLPEWRALNQQIPFSQFDADATRFDAIFMNDVFEHLSEPGATLKKLAGKLKDERSIIFIDTPRQFWLYPLTKLFSKGLHTKVLRGTVDHDHQQIWSRRAFELVASNAGLRIAKYRELSEFTMDPGFYLRNMGITNPALIWAGGAFYRSATHLAHNKIMAVLTRQSTGSLRI